MTRLHDVSKTRRCATISCGAAALRRANEAADRDERHERRRDQEDEPAGPTCHVLIIADYRTAGMLGRSGTAARIGLCAMRVLGVDFGSPSARAGPVGRHGQRWRGRGRRFAAGATPRASAEAVAALARARRVADDDEDAADIGAIVVGLPRRLNGEDTRPDRSRRASLRRALAALTGLDVHLQDERLSSHEAESRLALREKDWRQRKAKLDAAAAAVILQDYLDRA